MWYVVQVVGGKEKHVVSLMRKFVDDGLIHECFVPQYEIKKRFNGAWRLCQEVLLPGYVFIVTDDPAQVALQLRRVPAFTRLLSNNDIFIPLNDQEVSLINAFMDPDRRVVGMSMGVIEGDRVLVLNGPLMNHEGLIKKIDRHKRMAYLEIEILGRMKTVKIGLEIVAKRN